MSRLAKMTPKGIMVDTDQLHKLGPVNGAIAMIASLFNDDTVLSSVRYDGKEIVHLVIDKPNENCYVKCGLPAYGHATMWHDNGKRVNCKSCLRGKNVKV